MVNAVKSHAKVLMVKAVKSHAKVLMVNAVKSHAKVLMVKAVKSQGSQNQMQEFGLYCTTLPSLSPIRIATQLPHLLRCWLLLIWYNPSRSALYLHCGGSLQCTMYTHTPPGTQRL